MCQEVVLGALLSGHRHRSSLTTFFGTNLSPTAVGLLSDFKSLTFCRLEAAQGLDIEPLRALPHLSELDLKGTAGFPVQFDGVHTLSSLIKLSMRYSVIGFAGCPAYGFVQKLQHLKVSHGAVLGLHHDGLPAVRNLKSRILLGNSLVSGETTWRMGSGHDVQIPANMASLTQLSELRLHLSDRATELHLDWIWELRQLRALALGCSHPSTLGASLTRLSQLSFLRLVGDAKQINAAWCLNVDWKLMHSLCDAHFLHCNFDQLLGLVQAQNLRSLTLTYKASTDEALVHLMRLVGALQRSRQDVSVKLNGITL